MHNNTKDNRHLNALKNLLEMVQPRQLRRSVEDLFFWYYSECDNPRLTKDQIRDIHLLIEFLDELE